MLTLILANWTGVAYKIPRTELEKYKDRENLKYSGVYFLFGNSDKTGESVVYIGQADVRKNGEGVLNRLPEHKRNPKKDYWREAVVFITSNNSLGPTEISYLEHKFCKLAIDAKRYAVKNGNDPTPGNVTEEKESELNEFIDNAKLIMSITGHCVFSPFDDQASTEETSSETDLYLSRNIKQINMVVRARGRQTSEGFVVLKGSYISSIDDDSIPAIVKEQRRHAEITEDCMLLKDMLFSSPSYAAMFVTGKSANGLTSWKTADGTTLKQLESIE